MAYQYDESNIFAKILRGEIPNKTVAENEHALCFHDISPIAPLHLLVIPKGPYVNYDHFLEKASNEEKAGFEQLMLRTIQENGLASENGESGYRMISNAGAMGVQEVPHYHVHILSGEPIGPMRYREKK